MPYKSDIQMLDVLFTELKESSLQEFPDPVEQGKKANNFEGLKYLERVKQYVQDGFF